MEEKYSYEEEKSIKIGILVLIIVLIAVFFTISRNTSIKNRGTGETYNIYANFGRTDGLNVGDAVRMSGINIGRVVKAELDDGFNSKLTLEIDKKYKIPQDSSASIVSFGLIGGKYVEIEVGGDEEMIPSQGNIEYTQDAMVLEELLDRIITMGKNNRKNNSETKEFEKGENDE